MRRQEIIMRKKNCAASVELVEGRDYYAVEIGDWVGSATLACFKTRAEARQFQDAPVAFLNGYFKDADYEMRSLRRRVQTETPESKVLRQSVPKSGAKQEILHHESRGGPA